MDKNVDYIMFAIVVKLLDILSNKYHLFQSISVGQNACEPECDSNADCINSAEMAT